MYKLLSGAKSVKQYRGDENLPEAKKGMKNCGCKHPKTKYKYQFGSEDLKIKDEEKSPLSKRSQLLSEISTGGIDLRTGEKPKGFQTPSSDVLTKTKKYIPYSQMSDEDKVAYRKGISSGKEFEVGGRKYAAVPKQVQVRKTPVNINKQVSIKPKDTPQKETWTEDQWQNLLRERNRPTPKPTPVIPQPKQTVKRLESKPVLPLKVGNMPGYKPSKPIYEFDQVVNTPETKIKKTEKKGVFLDPKSKGVLMNQQGKPLPTSKNLRKTVEELSNLKNTSPQVNKPKPMDLRGPVSYALNKKRELDSKSLGEMKKIVSESNSLSSKTSKFFSNHGENKKDRIVNTNWDPNNEPLLVDKILPDGDVKQAILNNPVSSWPSLLSSAIKRKEAKNNPESERTTTIKVPDIDSSKNKSSEEKLKVIQKPDVYITGDTLKDRGSNRRYHLPEIIDLDSPNISYGTRNRGDYNEIETEGAPITSPYPFASSKQYFANSKDSPNVDYIGINSKGKVKVGKKNDFQDDDYQISKTLVQNVESFEGLKQAIGNKNFKSPQVNMITDSGVKMKTNLNFLVPKGNPQKAENAFDEVSGGRYIFETPDKNKRILVSGSLKTIKETFDKMKKNNPYLRIISLDNGSYAKGIRTFDQKLTPEDLKNYDAQNPEGGGNIVYIKSRVKKYKYGTGALTIPEGSAIVTANGGKNIQALKAYKKGNYKLLNKIIDEMPEDRVDRAKNGINSTLKRYKFKKGTNSVNADEDDAWIRKMLKLELEKGGFNKQTKQSFGLSNFGYNAPKGYYQDSNGKYRKKGTNELLNNTGDWKDAPKTLDEAVALFKKEYLPDLKDYPLDVRKRLGDYAYNSGRSVEDLLLLADNKITLDGINSNNVFTKEWNTNKDDILKKLNDPDFIKNLDNARTDVAKTTGSYPDPKDPTKSIRYSLNNPNPAFEGTWKYRIENFQDKNGNAPAQSNVPAPQPSGGNQNTPAVSTQSNVPVSSGNQASSSTPEQPSEIWTGAKKQFGYQAKGKGKLDYQKDRFNENVWKPENYGNWKKMVQEAIDDPERYKKVVSYLKNYKGQDAGDVQQILKEQDPVKLKQKIQSLSTDEKVGPFHTTMMEALKETEEKTKETPKEVPGETPKIPPPSTPPDEEWEEVEGTKFKVPPAAMSLGETTAIGSVLTQPIQRPKESYLKLDRYNYASQLPKTLREIQLAEQAGRESARDIVAGDAGRYLSQSGNLSSARMKAANDAVIQDTLARQDILNKNVDLSNTELSTNRSLKDYYDDIKRQNINDYNALLVKGGQSVDESFDNYQKMRNENIMATQGLQLMADMNPNYTLIQNPDGTYRTVSRYKKKSTAPASTPTSTPQQSSSTSSSTMFAPFNKGLFPPRNKPNFNTPFQQMMENPPQSGIGVPSNNNTLKSKLPRFGLPVPTIKEKGTKKAKTYKRK